jgi:hypothetical protein
MSGSMRVLSVRMLCVLTPTLAVLGFQRFVAPPSEARASDEGYGFVALPDVSGVDLSERERSSSIGSAQGSPLWFVEVEHQLAAIPEIEPSKETRRAPDPVFVLSAVLPSRTKPLAVVNGKPHREGDVIVPGWRLRSIDGDARSVIMEHESGRMVRVSMSQ